MKLSVFWGFAALLGASHATVVPQVHDDLFYKSPQIETPEWYETPFLKEAWTPAVADVWTQFVEKYGTEKAEAFMKAPQLRAQPKRSNVFTRLGKREGHEYIEDTEFPDHTLRVRDMKADLLKLDTGTYYTGYFDLHEEDKHLFYWFFPSRNDPKNDPVILWLNGGPGCSSATGMLFELGPSNLINGTLVHNPYSWNNNASVIFLDQPVGVGYSYYLGSDVNNTVVASKDFYAFTELFFKKFSDYAKNDFHIAGESFAGHYIPVYGAEIMSHPDRSFNLTSVMIGNGMFSGRIQHQSNAPMACGKGGLPAILTPDTCKKMQKSVKKCTDLGQQCELSHDVTVCSLGLVFCSTALENPVLKANYNIYDIRQKCSSETCYTVLQDIGIFLNSTDVKVALNIDPNFNYLACNDTITNNFALAGDGLLSTMPYLTLLLNDNVPVLLYAGDKDFICNWLGVKAVTLLLDFDKKADFAALKTAIWVTKGNQNAGEVQSGGNLTFLRVYNAGHMVPHDQPVNALDMVNRWLSGDRSYTK